MNASAARIIRICTLAPLLAAVMLVFLYAAQPEIFGSLGGLLRQLQEKEVFFVLQCIISHRLWHGDDSGAAHDPVVS